MIEWHTIFSKNFRSGVIKSPVKDVIDPEGPHATIKVKRKLHKTGVCGGNDDGVVEGETRN